jgi:hypothetical protein
MRPPEEPGRLALPQIIYFCKTPALLFISGHVIGILLNLPLGIFCVADKLGPSGCSKQYLSLTWRWGYLGVTFYASSSVVH